MRVEAILDIFLAYVVVWLNLLTPLLSAGMCVRISLTDYNL